MVSLEPIVYEDFLTVPLSTHQAEEHTRGVVYFINDILGIGFVTTDRYPNQYSAGNSASGIILGRDDGNLMVVNNLMMCLADGRYSAQDKDIQWIDKSKFKKMVVYPTKLEDLLPYKPSDDDQKDLDRTLILPHLRH